MPIIDAHIHFADRPGFARTARAAGHVNSVAHLQQTFADTGIVFAVVCLAVFVFTGPLRSKGRPHRAR